MFDLLITIFLSLVGMFTIAGAAGGGGGKVFALLGFIFGFAWLWASGHPVAAVAVYGCLAIAIFHCTETETKTA